MLKTIEQSIYFPATPKDVYEVFADARKHAAMTGAPVSLEPKMGGAFEAFGGMLTGQMLVLVPGRLIVQQWRSMHFKKGDLDSTLILTFNKKGKGCQLDLVHVNVAKHDYQGVTKGWKKYYWEPMKAYLKARSKRL